MAGGGIKNFTAEVGTSADVDTYLMQQGTMVFASTSARDSAFTAASVTPADGMYAYNTDDDELYRHDGTSWVPIDTKWTTYTPNWTNLTLNSGTTDFAKYRYNGGDLEVRGQITFAADTSVSGVVYQTIPNSVTADSGWQGGVGVANEVGVDVRGLVIGANPDATTVSWASSSGLVDATTPHTWGDADVLTWHYKTAPA